MSATDVLERSRLKLQDELDSRKTQAELNKLGQFATPTPLAIDILNYAHHLLPRGSVRFLDPAFGTGSFYSALLHTFPLARIKKAEGFEIDPQYGIEIAKLWKGASLTLHLQDFTKTDPNQSERDKPNLLICNPPYVRHHHLDTHEKLWLRDTAQAATGIRLNGLAGLYCYFLLISHTWMAENGLAAWLIPSEFMDVNYGREIKKYLLDEVTLLRIHRFDPDEVQFQNALVSSAVVWFKKSKPPRSHQVEFTYGGTHKVPKITHFVKSRELHDAPKWTKFSFQSCEEKNSATRTRLSDLFTIKRGVATGSNDFFVLTPEQIKKHDIPKDFLTPILPSPRYLKENEISGNRQGEPCVDKKRYLLTCNLPESLVKRGHPELWRYLELGRKQGVSERYLCKHRSPWYMQEARSPAPLLCTYMGRMTPDNGKPFRFILNHSKATAANVYLMLYPKPALTVELGKRPKLMTEIWEKLNRIETEELIGQGRVYGGGLYKLEPKELGNVPADKILNIVPESDLADLKQMILFDHVNWAYGS